MSEHHKNLEVYVYEPKEFFVLVGIITFCSTFLYLMCMCMNKFNKFTSVVEGELDGN